MMETANLFKALSSYLVNLGLSLRQLFWLTGILAFFISPLADNLTTALLMASVVTAIAPDNCRFISLSCINIVVAANAGGAFSPFGDITTLMVWQKGLVPFADFFTLFLPSLLNFLLPAFCMHWAIPKAQPQATSVKIIPAAGSYGLILLFALTLISSILLHHFLQLPPVLGMMLGLSFLQFYSYYLKRKGQNHCDIFESLKKTDWDTLLYFYGVMLCIGALGALGYLARLSDLLYSGQAALGPWSVHTQANVLLGIFSAILDNIPLMFALLTMQPDLSLGQWLLATLTAGVGGSLLSLGSAAGVALMGHARGHYTFLSHLKWTWAIALGYAASVGLHVWLNAALF
jgi:Na+/H+ antiporter NhaD/arsenite permease-like protein